MGMDSDPVLENLPLVRKGLNQRLFARIKVVVDRGQLAQKIDNLPCTRGTNQGLEQVP